MTDVTLTTEQSLVPGPLSSVPGPLHRTKDEGPGTRDFPLSTLCLRLEVDGVSLSWTLRGDDSDVASRLPRVLDYIRRLQAKLPRADPQAPSQRPTVVPPRETHDCEWHGPMRESTKAPGTWFCPKKKASGEYCPSRWPVRAGEQGA